MMEHNADIFFTAIHGDGPDSFYIPPDRVFIKTARGGIIGKMADVVKAPLIVHTVGQIRFYTGDQAVPSTSPPSQ